MKKHRKRDIDNLRPASPPKRNPWKINQDASRIVTSIKDIDKEYATSKVNDRFDHVAAEGFADRLSDTSKDTPKASKDIAGSREVLEAAAPRAREKYTSILTFAETAG